MVKYKWIWVFDLQKILQTHKCANAYKYMCVCSCMLRVIYITGFQCPVKHSLIMPLKVHSAHFTKTVPTVKLLSSSYPLHFFRNRQLS